MGSACRACAAASGASCPSHGTRRAIGRGSASLPSRRRSQTLRCPYCGGELADYPRRDGRTGFNGCWKCDDDSASPPPAARPSLPALAMQS